MSSDALYRFPGFPVCNITPNSRATKLHWKLGSWHIQQEFCEFNIFDKKNSTFFRQIALWQENIAKPFVMHRQVCLLGKK